MSACHLFQYSNTGTRGPLRGRGGGNGRDGAENHGEARTRTARSQVPLRQVRAATRAPEDARLPGALHRAACSAPPASAGCTGCIPCLGTRQRLGRSTAGTPRCAPRVPHAPRTAGSRGAGDSPRRARSRPRAPGATAQTAARAPSAACAAGSRSSPYIPLLMHINRLSLTIHNATTQEP